MICTPDTDHEVEEQRQRLLHERRLLERCENPPDSSTSHGRALTRALQAVNQELEALDQPAGDLFATA